MPEIDLPDPDESEERASNPFTRRVALFVAVYAVALAISSLGLAIGSLGISGCTM